MTTKTPSNHKQNMKLYYTTKKIAEMFSVSKDTVMRWVSQGLPFLDASTFLDNYPEYCNMRRFNPQEVEAWLKNRKLNQKKK